MRREQGFYFSMNPSLSLSCVWILSGTFILQHKQPGRDAHEVTGCWEKINVDSMRHEIQSDQQNCRFFFDGRGGAAHASYLGDL